ncbi:MAG: 3',5'-cyclic-AMP phosphodiesterase [Endozoicomonas sp.]
MSPVRIIQLTDTHLFGSHTGRLLGADTNSSFLAVLEQVASDPVRPDCILVTGDLTQDHSLASYEFLREKLETLGTPHYWLCGNHDQFDLMFQVSPSSMTKRVAFRNWQILLLDSHVDDEIPGQLSEQELMMLDECLSRHPHHHSLVALHHPPYAVQSRWLDEISLLNAGQLLEVLSCHNNVRVVVNGHIHQARDLDIDSIRFLSTPSTCIQFKPKTKEFTLDSTFPGYRQLDLLESGEIKTKVVRLEGYHQQVDEASSGY